MLLPKALHVAFVHAGRRVAAGLRVVRMHGVLLQRRLEGFVVLGKGPSAIMSREKRRETPSGFMMKGILLLQAASGRMSGTSLPPRPCRSSAILCVADPEACPEGRERGCR